MRRGRITAVLACGALLGGCAAAPQAGNPAAAGPRDGRAAARAETECTTTWLVLATVSKCGSGGMRFGIATE